MAKVYLVKRGLGLVAAEDSDKEQLDKLKRDEIYQCEIKQPRNVKFHRKYWQLLNTVFSNLPEEFYVETVSGQKDYIKSTDDLHWHIKCQCGIMTKRISLGGRIMYEVGSIAFHKMDELEFSKFYEKALDVICKYFLIGTEKEFLREEIEMFY